jgi:hypothetical protein
VSWRIKVGEPVDVMTVDYLYIVKKARFFIDFL